MDKKFEGPKSISGFFKCVLMVAVICLLDSCTQTYTQSVNITEGGYKAELDGVLIGMSPTVVAVGEDVAIELSHKQGKKVEVEIKSTSLSYQKIVKTPSSVKIKVEAEGVHDISFAQTNFGSNVTCDAIIVCE